MTLFNFDPSTLLFAGAWDVAEGTPLGPHQTAMPLDLKDPRSNQYVFDGQAWRHDPRAYDRARAAAEMDARKIPETVLR